MRPIRVGRVVRERFPCPEGLLGRLDRLVPTRATEAMDVSGLLHLCHYYGVDVEVTGGNLKTPTPVLSVLTDNRLSSLYYGEAVLHRTRYGIRFVTSINQSQKESTREHHRDQTLSVLAECGVPLSQPLTFGTETFHLSDVLDDSVANFTLDQDELHWTALAYAIFMPERQTWQNHFGETFSFDDVANALLLRDLSGSSCAGTHVFYTLAIIDRVACERPILSDGMHVKVLERLREFVRVAGQTQRPDGSWTTQWHLNRFDRSRDLFRMIAQDGASEQLVATGHLGEVFLILSPRIELPTGMLARAHGWLCRSAERLLAGGGARLSCPVTHVAFVARERSVRDHASRSVVERPAVRSEDQSKGERN
ncbi:MAG TPA: hypothetical protein VG055_29815 [Planctomycetaceae bacterium]|nr:hypothetical protein [Planctomycetaceae bacterium]